MMHLLRRRPHFNSNRGLTFMEMLVAITIVLIIMAGVVWSFVELLQSHDKARARMDATANARSAMETLSLEVKRARNTTGTLSSVFIGQTDSVVGGGDRINQDGDGAIDEELFDGKDNDGDFVLATSDRHAIIPAGANQYAERPVFYQNADLDDGGIDEDLGATSASVEFDTYDVPGDPLDRHVRFYVGNDPDGQPNTLMRVISGIDPTTSNTVSTSGPICYNVVSFGLLYWDHSLAKNSGANPWQTEWPPVTTSPLTVAPSSVYMRISVYAGTPYPLAELPANLQIETVNITTMVNVEAVLADPTYVAQRTAVPIATSP